MVNLRLMGSESTPIRFDVAPVHNALCSVCLLGQTDLGPISSWVDRTSRDVPDRIRAATERACGAVKYYRDGRYRDLGDWLNDFARVDPREIAQIDARRAVIMGQRFLPISEVPSASRLLSDREAYVALDVRLHEVHGKTPDAGEAGSRWDDLHAGSRYRDEVAATLEYLWTHHLRDEWYAVRGTIEEAVDAFRSVPFQTGTTIERLKLITDRDEFPQEWNPIIRDARQIVFVPSVHIGPYMLLFDFDGTTAWIVGHARVPEGSPVRSSALDRSDLLIRLEALSDEARLRILEMAARDGEVTTQDVMNELSLSQSSASRHLTQLGATGLVHVDGSVRTKRYRINEARIRDVCTAIAALADRATASG